VQPRQELFGCPQVLVEAAPHPFTLGHHDRHPRIAGEELAAGSISHSSMKLPKIISRSMW
jgi:hypothetical protein